MKDLLELTKQKKGDKIEEIDLKIYSLYLWQVYFENT